MADKQNNIIAAVRHLALAIHTVETFDDNVISWSAQTRAYEYYCEHGIDAVRAETERLAAIDRRD